MHPPLSIDFDFDWFSTPGQCRLTLGGKEGPKGPTVVCTQRSNYFGPSITNAVEQIAAKLYRDIHRKLLPPKHQGSPIVEQILQVWSRGPKPVKLSTLYGAQGVTWIEHYPVGTGLVALDTFRQVTFDEADNPSWMDVFKGSAAAKEFGYAVIGTAALKGQE